MSTIYGALIFTEYIDGRMVKTWMALLLFLISCYLLAIYNNVDITPYAHSLKEIPNKPGHVRSAAEKIFFFFFFLSAPEIINKDWIGGNHGLLCTKHESFRVKARKA